MVCFLLYTVYGYTYVCILVNEMSGGAAESSERHAEVVMVDILNQPLQSIPVTQQPTPTTITLPARDDDWGIWDCDYMLCRPVCTDDRCLNLCLFIFAIFLFVGVIHTFIWLKVYNVYG